MLIDFKYLFILLFFCFIFSFLLNILSLLLSNKIPDKEKLSSYECGFNPIYTPSKPFSIRFFLIAILFLIFDLEITYLFPWSLSTNLLSLKTQFIVFLFILFLIFGLIYEWVRGGLEWE